MFGFKDPSYPYFYLGFVPIIWIAMRQGIRRAVTGLLLMNFGIVIAMHLFPPTAVVFTKVALLMTMLSVIVEWKSSLRNSEMKNLPDHQCTRQDLEYKVF